MLLTIDVGNTQNVLGLYDPDSDAGEGASMGLVDHWRISTDADRSSDEYSVMVRSLLDTAGVDVDERGYITVDDQLRTSGPGIWALGDCNARGAFTHTAYNDYEIVAANLLDDDPRRVTDRIACYGLFIDPPLGRVGMTETEVRASGRSALAAKRPMKHVARAVEKSETQGFMKITVDADSKQILGAAILGVGGDEAIHSIADVMYAKAPYTVIQRAVHIHPTVSELIPTMLGDLNPLT